MGLGLALSPTIAAWAASFNCAGVTNPIEIAICTDQSLSAIDEELSSTYHAHLAKLTPEGAKKLTGVEKHFIREVRQSCTGTEREVRNCIKRSFTQQISLLRSLDKSGLTLTLDGVFKPALGDDTYPIDAVWPEIDEPTAYTEKTNNIIRRTVHRLIPHLQDNRNYVLAVTLNYASEYIISITISSNFYPSMLFRQGTYLVEYVNLIPKDGREIVAADFFAKGADWRKLVRRSCEKKLEISDEDFRVEIALKRWEFSPKGVTFDCTEQQASNMPPIRAGLTWNELRPFLKNDAPVPHS
jgi:uncharacterized protein